MKLVEILADDMITEWFDSQQYASATEVRYGAAMHLYTEYTSLTPNELILEAEDDIRQGLLPRERKIKHHLMGFRKHLIAIEHAPTSIRGEMAAVKSFYRSFDIDIPSLTRSRNKAKPNPKRMEIPDAKDIREILNFSTLRNRAIVLCGCSGGLGATEIVNLKVHQFEDGYDPETEITTLYIRRQKVNYDYITFLSPEASRAVKAYLDWRNRSPEHLTHALQQKRHNSRKVLSGDNYLFIPERIQPSNYKPGSDEDRKLGVPGLAAIFRKLAICAGKGTAKHEWQNIRSHTMRKYFNNSLLNAGADIFFVDYLMGHTLDDTRSAYYRADPEALKKKYIKYLPFLAIEDTEVHTIESAEYRMLREQNADLEAKVAKMETLIDDGIAAAVAAEVEKIMKTMNPR